MARTEPTPVSGVDAPSPVSPWRRSDDVDGEMFEDGDRLLVAGIRRPGSDRAWYSIVEVSCDEGRFGMTEVVAEGPEYSLDWGDFEYWARLYWPGHNP